MFPLLRGDEKSPRSSFFGFFFGGHRITATCLECTGKVAAHKKSGIITQLDLPRSMQSTREMKERIGSPSLFTVWRTGNVLALFLTKIEKIGWVVLFFFLEYLKPFFFLCALLEQPRHAQTHSRAAPRISRVWDLCSRAYYFYLKNTRTVNQAFMMPINQFLDYFYWFSWGLTDEKSVTRKQRF